MKKPNLQSPLDRLTDAQQHDLYLALQKITLEDGVALARREYSVRTTTSSLDRFLKRRGITEELRANVYASTAFADSEDVAALDKRKRAAVVAAMWEALTRKDNDSICGLGHLLVKMDGGDRQREQLELAREKFEAAEKRANAARDVLSDARLTPEQKEARMREVFG